MEESPPAILVADDDLATLHLLGTALEDQGYRVYPAQNGEQALEILKQHPLTVILCDQYMPKISGLEVLKQAICLQPDAARIVITGVSDLKTAADLVNEGQISHFILKPWDQNVLIHAVRSSIERVRLIRENRRLQELTLKQHQELEKNHERLQGDLVIGGRIQSVLLEGKLPKESDGLAIKGLTIPSQVIDGDFYDLYRPSSRFIDIVIGDVMGKGLPAALVGTAVKTQLARFALPSLPLQSFSSSSGWEEAVLAPEEILAKTHAEISPSLIELEFFVCLTYARFDLQKRLLSFIDCGSTKPLHFQAASKEISLLSGSNLPLGIREEESYEPVSVPYHEGDLFIFYSDGVSEARAPSGELFGVPKLAALVREKAGQPPEAISKAVEEAVQAFTDRKALQDDLTLIIFKVEKLKDPEEFLPPNLLRCTNDLSQLEAVRQFVGRICKKAPGNAEKLSYLMELAVNEAFCNLVKHGYKEGESGEILIEGAFSKEAVHFSIKDRGAPFDPSAAENPSLTGERESGFGLYLIGQIADRISYSPKQTPSGWNRLELVKSYFEEATMDLSYEKKNDILVIKIEGENLDAKEAPGFKQKAIDLIDSNASSKVILDLDKLHFIDSTGLGSFLSLLRILNKKKGDLKMASMPPSVRTVFELVCMHKIFEIYNTIEEAIRSYRVKSG